MSILLYGCTTWTLTKRMEKKRDGNCTRKLWAVLNKFWKQHSTKRQLYGYLALIQVRRTRHAGHYRRSKDKPISDVLLWNPSHRRARVGWPTRTYLQQLCTDTGCSVEDLRWAIETGGERGSGKSAQVVWRLRNITICKAYVCDEKLSTNFSLAL